MRILIISAHAILINHVFANEYRMNIMKGQQKTNKKEEERGGLEKYQTIAESG